MPPSYFPLRWESTGDQWWYASPIDWAAANGLYDLVIELLHLDTNLLIKLTSLRRIRRLETVWDDEAAPQFDDVAKCRSLVARRLLQECEATKKGNNNSLIRAGYGGWLLYTAASAGDVDFVKELLERDPLLVFGEGEYGVTDIFYAAARSKNSDVFTMLLDLTVSSRSCISGGEGEQVEDQDQLSETWSAFKWEMMNRAVHAAARGGSLEILREILGDCSDILVYRDEQGCTILHTASGRGQVEVVKDLVASFDIINSIDNQGNTALHVAAYRGYLKVMEFLIHASPTLASVKNNHGNTFLHVAVAGYRTLGFRRMDRQIELMKQLVRGEVVDNIQDIINVRNLDGRTALHMAVTDQINFQSNLVELLMTVPSIDLNALDADGMTPLDLLKRQPKSAASEILIKELIAAGGISNFEDNVARNSIVSHLREQGIGGSPGTSFRIPDAEIFLYTGSDNAGCDQESVEYSSCLSELNDLNISNSLESKKFSSINHTARRLKFFLQWPRKKERKASGTESVDGDPLEVMSSSRNWSDSHIPLREKYSKSSFLPSKSTRKKFTAELTHGVIQAAAQNLASAPFKSPPTSPFSASSSVASPISMDEQKGVRNARHTRSNPSFDGRKTQTTNQKQTSFDKRSMNQYFCFGAQGLAVEDSRSHTRLDRSLVA